MDSEGNRRLASQKGEAVESLIQITEPEVTLLAITRGINGASPQEVIELAARDCYQSFAAMKPGQSERFLRGLLVRGHESVVEHASATFRILGASRAYTHEQVRHRLASYSQQSQRYVSEADFRVIVPPRIAEDPEAARQYRTFMAAAKEMYRTLQEIGFKNEDARFVLPNAVESGLVATFNFRELRHIFDLRLSPAAQWEIRRVAAEMLKIMQKEAPAIFEEFILDEETCTATRCGKLISCEKAQVAVRDLAGRHERILQGLEDPANLAPLSHIVNCYNPACQQVRLEIGDLR